MKKADGTIEHSGKEKTEVSQKYKKRNKKQHKIQRKTKENYTECTSYVTLEDNYSREKISEKGSRAQHLCIC